MGLLYSALCYLLFPFALPVLLVHPKLRRGIAARLGLHPSGWPALPADAPRIWLHGASAGDVLALVPLARELRARAPRAALVLSTLTNTGRAIAERERDAFDQITYLPYDLPGPVGRSLDRVAPHILVLEYTELWPHLIRGAARRGVRVVLHNGRFAAGRLGRYRLLFALTGDLIARLRLLLVRSAAEAERAQSLGAAAERIRVTGNTKLDNVRAAPAAREVAALRPALSGAGPLWVAGSIHAAEETLLLEVFGAVRRVHPELRLVLAPRYVDRAPRLLRSVTGRGLTAALRSAGPSTADVVILDTIGELAAAYALADLVFVGGSFCKAGGHNLLEPAASGKAVVFGPRVENVVDSVQLLLGRGGLQVATAAQLTDVLADLLDKPQTRRELGELARSTVRGAQGAAARNAELILGLLPGEAAATSPHGDDDGGAHAPPADGDPLGAQRQATR